MFFWSSVGGGGGGGLGGEWYWKKILFWYVEIRKGILYYSFFLGLRVCEVVADRCFCGVWVVGVYS